MVRTVRASTDVADKILFTGVGEREREKEWLEKRWVEGRNWHTLMPCIEVPTSVFSPSTADPKVIAQTTMCCAT